MSLTCCQFWLKSHHPAFNELQVGQRLRMAAQFSLDSPDAGPELWEVVLFGVFLLGVGVGVKAVFVGQRLAVWWSGQSEASWSPAQGLNPPGWHSVVLRALRFIRRRRKVALAFANYRTKPLKHSPSLESGWSDRPSEAFKASKAKEGWTPLVEGPAFRHGAHRNRAGSD